MNALNLNGLFLDKYNKVAKRDKEVTGNIVNTSTMIPLEPQL